MLEIISKVPTLLWIIIGICLVFPLARIAIKKGLKLVGVIAIVVALLFIFPSIGSSFMDRAGLTWDNEKKSLTNRNGTEISLEDILSKGKDVTEMIKNSEKVNTVVNSAKKEAKELTELINGEDAGSSTDTGLITSIKNLKITPEMISKAKDIGLQLTEEMGLTYENGKFYLEAEKNKKYEMSESVAEAIGVLKELTGE